jgi:outer membrane protein OmpA-like peptidoglycan-associated protein
MQKVLIFLFFIIIFYNKTYGQAGTDLPILEDFESDSVWVWKPWTERGDSISFISKTSAHSGKFGLDCKWGDLVKRTEPQIGLPGQAISWWVRFQGKARAHCGFGINASEQGYYLCVDPSTNTFHFAKSPDYTYPLLKMVNQNYTLNVWYRVEVAFNTKTNITGKLYAANGTKLLNSITLEIPDLSPGGIAFKGLALHVDDIRGGSRIAKPATETLIAPKPGEPFVLHHIQFESDKSVLLQQSFPELDKLVEYLKRNPSSKLDISGHTDDSGNEAHNKELSEARAKAVATYLIQHGIDKTLIRYAGYGSSKPLTTNVTEEGRQKNRRVEFMILKI